MEEAGEEGEEGGEGREALPGCGGKSGAMMNVFAGHSDATPLLGMDLR
jgi:hypothetical protein